MTMAAYAQFGYGYPTASQLLVGGGGQTTTTAASAQSPLSGANAPSLSPSGGSATGAPTGALSPGAMSQTSNAPVTGSCCENGRPIMTDPVSGQTVCSCQYDSARLALSGYSRIPTAGVGVYGTPYPSTDQNPYPSIGVDSSAFYSPLSNPYGLKESGPTTDMSAWTSAGLQPTTGYYPYDPTLAAYGYGAGYDLAARRKNATRESTATLKAWLNEHKKNPYPTKGEKIMLAIITKMTLTQVSTWFANARRRLKKENKMTWEPKNKTDDDDDAMVSDEDKDKDDMDSDKNRDHKDSLHHVKSEHDKDDDDDDLTDDDRKPENLGLMPGHGHAMSHHSHSHHPAYQHHQHHSMLAGYPGIKEEISGGPKNQTSSDCGVPIPATKPKIWSLADTAACKTPPPTGHHHHLLGHHHPSQQQQQQQQQQQHQLHQLQQASLHHSASTNTTNNQGHHQSWMGNYQQHHQQQMQQHQQHSNNSSGTINQLQNGGNGTTAAMMNMSGHMNMGAGMTHQQQQQQQHLTNTQQTQSPSHQHQAHHRQQQLGNNPNNNTNTNNQMNMMNTFGNSPYSRYGGFLGSTTNTNSSIPTTAHQMYNSNNMIGSTTTSPTTNPSTPITPTTPIHPQQQHQQTNHQQQHQHQQQSMGFPEVQTDTPPQTPPNLKLPSVAGNLITGTATPTTGTCYNINSNNSNNASNNNNCTNLTNNNNSNTANNNLNTFNGESSPSSNGSYVGNFTRIQDQQMLDSPHQDGAVAAFKPFFKSQQISNGFVSPV